LRRRDLLFNAGTAITGVGLASVMPAGASLLSPRENRKVEIPECAAHVHPEPDAELAQLWWAAPRNVWTPVGWKDHLFRFNSVYNGTLLCVPAGWLIKPHTKRYVGTDFQLNFTVSTDGTIPPIPSETTKLYKTDGGVGRQGWREDKEAPVLWTEWPCQEGVVMRQELFGHLKGGRLVETGVEPLYAWLRLSVSFVHPIRPPERFSFGIQLSKTYYDVDGTIEDSVFLAIDPARAALTKPLTGSSIATQAGKQSGLSILQENLVRLLLLPGGDGKITLRESAAHSGIYHVIVDLPAQVGAHTDILIPMLPEPYAAIHQEATLGYDGALAQCEQFWSAKPATAARIHTPERQLNQALRRNIQFAEVIAERNPETGDYSFLTGSYGYDTLWSTPTSMVSHMFLDLLGYHDVVETHTAIYKKYQGTVKPPGAVYSLHPGYFSTPKTLTSIDWLSDHGAILETLTRHALITGRKDFVEAWIGPILKGCDFIKDACAITAGPGVKGIVPPAVATDSRVPTQAVWNEAWTYKGLMSAIAMLKSIHHPRASEFQTLSESFQSAFAAAFRERIPSQPEWTTPDGTSQHILPTDLIPSPVHHVYDDAFLLDTGPLVLPWAGLVNASDPAMRSFEDFFRVGPNNELHGPQTGAISRAVLRHEISSCEVCYSWNIVNSWKRGDRERFLEGMYSLFTGGLSPQTYINCEHRNAMYGNIFVIPLLTWCIRQSVIDDQLADGELHLLRLCPQAWISSEEETIFENMPTFFGVIDLRFRLSADSRALNLSFHGHWRDKPKRIVLHTPDDGELLHIVVNGKRYRQESEIDLATV
jgi:hypothetical protein